MIEAEGSRSRCSSSSVALRVLPDEGCFRGVERPEVLRVIRRCPLGAKIKYGVCKSIKIIRFV